MANNENYITEEQAVKKWKVRDKHGHVKKSGSLAVVGSVNVEVDSTGGDQPTADSTYQNGQLGITFHDIKGDRGNGITSIDTVESQEDDGYNVVRIHCTDDESEDGTVLKVKNGSKGDKGEKGDKGDQGDSVIVGEGDLPMAHVLGESTQKAMSQKGVSDAFDAQFGHAEADLSISDEDGNNIVEFGEGHVKTKNFDSSNIGTINLSEEVKDGIFRERTAHSQADLDVSDEEGYIIMRLQGGHVKTKNFDSSKLAQKEVSLSGIYSRGNPFGTDAEIIYKDAAMRMLPDNVVPLIIIAGQSNADGRAPYATAENWEGTEWLAEAEYQVQDYYMWDSAKSGFETYNVLTNNGAGTDEGSDGSGKNNYAFDPFFAKAFIDHYGKPIYAIRQTLGGVGIYDTVKRPSPLYSTWNAKIGYFEKQGVENVNYLLLNLISKIKDAQDWAAKNNKILLPVAILWHQGEHDANATAISQYKENLSEVISFMRGIFHAPALPFICGYISDSYNEYCPQINAVFEEMAEEDTYMKVVDMEGHYTFKDTNLHYDGQALAYMGEQMFDYYLQLNSLI